VSFITSASDGPERWEERRELPCESLRGPLKLPSCPTTVDAKGATFVFEGRGQGHGEGLDLEWAARSGLSAEALVEKAYGR
jgi:peptidoglycan hydrolase-like amidase